MGSESGVTANAIEGSVHGPVFQAQSIGEVHIHGADQVVPFQVPGGPGQFVGRESVLGELTRLRKQGPVVVCGMAGVGKTSVVLQWARRVVGEFPDGQLYADLGGVEPTTPFGVLEWFLLSLGTAPEQVPGDLDRRAGLFRSLTARRRLLVVLDDAVSAAQVRPLIPAGSGCAVVVTSRSRLSGLGLHGARWVDLQPLAGADSVRLLRSVVGDERVAAEVDAAHEVARLCGGLPLALSVVGARLAIRARRTLAREVADLAGERTRLAGLTLGQDASVAAVLDLARDGLDDDARAAYACAGWHPGREFGAEAIAAGLGVPAPRAGDALITLVESGLADEPSDERYAMHDLIRLHARETGPSTSQRTVIEWYLDTAIAADTVVHPLRLRLSPRYDHADAGRFPDSASAIGWLERERANLRAAVDTAAERRWDELTWQLCEAMWGLFLHHRHYGDWIDMQRKGIAAAARLGDQRAEARIRLQAGYAHGKIGQIEEHRAHATAARDLARAAGDPFTEASALENLGTATLRSDPEQAITHLVQARDRYRELGRKRGIALCTRRIGEALSALGRWDDAATELADAAAAMADLGDPTQHTRAVTALAEVHRAAGEPDRALAALTDALAVMRRFGSRYYQAEILTALADAGHPDAERLLAEAADLYEEVGDPAAQVIRSRLAAQEPPQRT